MKKSLPYLHAALAFLTALAPCAAQPLTITLTGSEADDRSDFGTSVALVEGAAFVGAPSHDMNVPGFTGRAGAVYVFERQPDGVTWAETQILRHDLSVGGYGSDFGRVIAAEGNRLVISTTNRRLPYNAFEPLETQVHVYEKAAPGAAWSRAHVITLPNLGGGTPGVAPTLASLSLSGNRLAAGFYDAVNSQGKVHIYERQGGGTWALKTTLVSGEPLPQTTFGFSVALHGDRLLVGSSGTATPLGAGAGRAYVFEYDGAAWNRTASLEAGPTQGGVNYGFGASVALRGSLAVIGAPALNGGTAAAFFFEEAQDGSWRQRASISPAGAAFTGLNVRYDGQRAFVSMLEDSGQTGRVRSYERQSMFSWSEVGSFSAPDPDFAAEFAGSYPHVRLAAHSGSVLVGANKPRNEFGEADGAAFLFTTAQPPPNQPPSELNFTPVTLYDRSPSGSLAGSFSAVDPDNGETFVYHLASGAGDDDNNAFVITNGSELRTVGSLEISTKQHWNIRVRVTDSAGHPLTRSFVVSLTPLLPAQIQTQGGIYADDGLPKEAQVQTNPPTVAYRVTYNGSEMPPRFPGVFQVVARVIEPGYEPAQDTAVITILEGGFIHMPHMTDIAEGSAPFFLQPFQSTNGQNVTFSGNNAGVLDISAPDSQNRQTATIQGPGGVLLGATAAASYDVQRHLTIVPRLLASDGAANMSFGNAVALHGRLALVGASNASQTRENQGAAYVYEKQADGSWLQTARIEAADGAAFNHFGTSVAILDPQTIAVGAPNADNIRGAIYIFRKTAGVWTQIQKISPSDTTKPWQLGNKLVAADGRLFSTLQASPGAAVLVFSPNSGGTHWSITQTLPMSSVPGSLAAGGGWLAVALEDTRSTSASTQVQTWKLDSVTGQFVTAGPAIQPPAGDPASDHFGEQVAVTGDFLAISAPYAVLELQPGLVNPNAGKVELYQHMAGAWQHIQTLLPEIPHDLILGHEFGRSIHAAKSMIVVGNLAHANKSNCSVFQIRESTNLAGGFEAVHKATTFTQASGLHMNFISVTTDGEFFMIGNPNDTVQGVNSGSAVVLDSRLRPTSLGGWAYENLVPPGLAGPQDAPAQDGVPNLLKYALGLDPQTNTGNPTQAGFDPNLGLALSFRIPALPPSHIAYTVEIQQSINGPWEPVARKIGDQAWVILTPGAQVEETVLPDFSVRVRVTTPNPLSGLQFIRLLIDTI